MLSQLATETAWTVEIRLHELNRVLKIANIERGSLLEIGGGSGHQARRLVDLGIVVRSFDVLDCPFRDVQAYPIETYDGRTFPVERASMDWVFSSNVLEHVHNLDTLDAEIVRVLRPQGRAVHVLPTHHWRLWTSIATPIPPFVRSLHRLDTAEPEVEKVHSYSETHSIASQLRSALSLARSCIAPHGVRGNALSEYSRYFRPGWWRAFFVQRGWSLVCEAPLGLFYTGHLILRNRLSLEHRRQLSRLFGASTVCFVLKRTGSE